jgi:hypothetical protein
LANKIKFTFKIKHKNFYGYHFLIVTDHNEESSCFCLINNKFVKWLPGSFELCFYFIFIQLIEYKDN